MLPDGLILRVTRILFVVIFSFIIAMQIRLMDVSPMFRSIPLFVSLHPRSPSNAMRCPTWHAFLLEFVHDATVESDE